MKLPFFIALRYLRSKKSLNIINMVSYISLIGVICGTAALTIVLSVFNGFEDLTKSIYRYFDPELKITVKEGKTFYIDSLLLEKINALPAVTGTALTLDENVLLKYEDRQTLAIMKGVDSHYEATTEIRNSMYDGTFKMHIADVLPSVVLGYNVAAKLGVYNLRTERPIIVYVPKREGRVSLSNPTESLNSLSVFPSGVFEIERSFDDTYAFAPIEFMQELLDKQGQVSSIEIKLKSENDMYSVQKTIGSIIPESLQVKTRYQQNEAIYKMMKSEKLIVYAILVLIVVILSFNISGSLSMLITEKNKDIDTLRSIGATNALIKRIFLFVGILITLLGILSGLFLGVTICLLQQHFGLLKLPGTNLLVDAYPVKLLFTDILIVIVSVFIIGYLASVISVSRLKDFLS